MSELDGARVDVSVLLSPASYISLHNREGFSLKVNRLGSDGQGLTLITTLGLRGQKSHNGNTTNSPLGSRGGHVVNGN